VSKYGCRPINIGAGLLKIAPAGFALSLESWSHSSGPKYRSDCMKYEKKNALITLATMAPLWNVEAWPQKVVLVDRARQDGEMEVGSVALRALQHRVCWALRPVGHEVSLDIARRRVWCRFWCRSCEMWASSPMQESPESAPPTTFTVSCLLQRRNIG
jgi:hypothetical protein